FERDLVHHTTAQVDVTPDGHDPNVSIGPETRASMSDDGRYVAFSSYATNLVVPDTSPTSDVYVRDMVAGVTTRVSTEATCGSYGGSISDDGRYVLFSA